MALPAAACKLPVDRRPLLAALGVLSHESIEQRALRDSLRQTMGVGKLVYATMSSGATDFGPILSRFVLRASSHSTRASGEREAAMYGDVVLLEQNCSLSGTLGPNGKELHCPGAALLSLLGWFRCALSVWPGAWVVGKAEPDAYVYLPGVANHLSLSLAAVQTHEMATTRGASQHGGTSATSGAVHAAARLGQIYWGAFELYHWMTHPKYHAARGHYNGAWWRLSECRNEPMPKGRIGPFGFAKGPLLFVSSALAHSVIHDVSVAAEADATIRFAEKHGSSRVWEDVFLGLAVTIAARQPVHMVEDSGWYLESGPAAPLVSESTLVAHLRRNKSAAFVHRVHRYLQKHHCTPQNQSGWRIRISYNQTLNPWRLCSGARLYFGEVDHAAYKAANCSQAVILRDG
jgi:hypothetical protein